MRPWLYGVIAAVVVGGGVAVAVLTLGGEDEPGPSPTPSGPTAPDPSGPTVPEPSGPTAPEPSGPTGATLPTGPTASTGSTGSEGVENTTPISIPDSGPADVYPSDIQVSGLDGTVVDVNVTIDGLTHTFADDVDLLLVGPHGETAVLMADVGGDQDNAAVGVTITFDDAATQALPDRAPVVSGVYRPTSGTNRGRDGACCDFAGGAPAPAPPYGTSLGVFTGIDPNGTWSLYAFDDTAQDSGEIAGGWSLEIVT